MGWLQLALQLLPLIAGAVRAVEKLATGKRGKEKQDAAVETVRVMLGLTEALTGQDIMKDEDVEKAVRDLIDAIVAVENAVARGKKDQG